MAITVLQHNWQNKQTNCLEFIFCPYATSSFGCIIAVLLLQYYCNYFSLQKLNQVLFSLMVLQVRTYLVKYVENRVGGEKRKIRRWRNQFPLWSISNEWQVNSSWVLISLNPNGFKLLLQGWLSYCQWIICNRLRSSCCLWFLALLSLFSSLLLSFLPCASQSVPPFLCSTVSALSIVIYHNTGRRSATVCEWVCVYIIDSLWVPGSNLCIQLWLAVCRHALLPDNPDYSWLDAERPVIRNSWWSKLKSHYWLEGWCHLTWALW